MKPLMQLFCIVFLATILASFLTMGLVRCCDYMALTFTKTYGWQDRADMPKSGEIVEHYALYRFDGYVILASLEESRFAYYRQVVK